MAYAAKHYVCYFYTALYAAFTVGIDFALLDH